MEPKTEPDFTVYRFKVFNQGRNPLLEPEKRWRNINFQICGYTDEYLSIRVYMDEYKVINDVRCYFFEGFDREMAELITRALIQHIRVKYEIAPNVKYKYLELWNRKR